MSYNLNLGDDLLIRPQRALEPSLAYRIMSFCMRNGSVATLQLPRDRLGFSWPLRFAVYSSGANLKGGHSARGRLVPALFTVLPRRGGTPCRERTFGRSRHHLEVGAALRPGNATTFASFRPKSLLVFRR